MVRLSSHLLLFFGLCVLLHALAHADGLPPEVTTLPAVVTGVGQVALSGKVGANDGEASVTIEYGTTTAYGMTITAAPTAVSAYNVKAVSAVVGGLDPATTYHFRVSAMSLLGTTNGQDMTVTPGLPAVTTNAVVATGIGSVSLNGTVNGWGANTAVSFEFGTTTSYGWSLSATPSNVSATTPTAVTATLNGLTTATMYHCRAKAVNANGTVYGDDVTFVAGQPTVVTQAATSIGTGQATLQGTVKGNGLSSTVSFEYGQTTSYGSTAVASPSSIATDQNTTVVSAALSGLNSSATYHYRTKAVTSAGTVYGQDMAVTPKSGAPAATTVAASAVTSGGATLQGIVNANNASTTVTFQYGTTTGYGSTVAGAPSSVTGTSNTAVTAGISGFGPGTTVHYRAVAANSSGTAFGADMVFTTTPNAPSISGMQAASITASSAQMVGGVSANGGSTVVTFEYGLTTSYGTSTPAWQSPLASGSATVNGQISGLVGGALYHCRVRVVNAGGEMTSPDSTFTTAAANAAAPVVTTLAALPVNSIAATFNGIVNGNGSNTTVFFDYGTTTRYTNSVFATGNVNGAANTAVTANASNLTAGTTYHFRVRASNGNGEGDGMVYGADMSFTTPAAGVIVAETGGATLLAMPLRAQLNGYVSANGGPTVTAVAFEYGTDTNYGFTVNAGGGVAGTGIQPVNAVIPLFGTSVTYHYRIRATTASGTIYGDDMTFVTPDPQDASLAGLVLSGTTLQPGFATGTTSYMASVPYNTASIQFTPTLSQSLAQVKVNGFFLNPGNTFITLPVNLGDNTFNVVVTSIDGSTTETYTVVVTRGQPKAGDLDFTFGSSSGKARLSAGIFNSSGSQVLQQPDGKLLVAGQAGASLGADVALLRLMPDGSLDTTFNGTGIVTTDNGGHGDFGVALALQADGRILVAGYTTNGTETDFLLLRYNSDGTPDTGFNGSGMVVTPLGGGNDMATGVAVQGDGGIVVAGTSWNGTDNDFAVVRYTSTGGLDTTFNLTGKVVTDFGGHLDESAGGMVLRGSGIVVAGTTSAGGTAVACYTGTGALDTSFNGTGLVTTRNGMSVSAVAVQSDGKIVVAGSTINGNGNGDDDFTLLRYTSTGMPDAGFNGTGSVTTDFGAGSYDDPRGVVIQGDGKIVVVGRSATSSQSFFVLARYDSLGAPDEGFGNSGQTSLSFGSFDQGAYGVALQDDGKIVAAGIAGISSNETVAVARFLGDGPGMAVTESGGVEIFDGLTGAEIGAVLSGGTVSQSFTIENSGLADLTGFGLTITGADAGSFTATTTPAAPAPDLAATHKMTLTVSFTPSSIGTKTAVLHVASNVAGSNGSFDIALTGSGLTDTENWRLTWFGTIDKTGNAADSADPDNDGLPNLIEYAFGMSPTVASGAQQIPQPQIVGDHYVLSFTQPNGVSGITYGAACSATLNVGDWHGVPDTGSGNQHVFSAPINGNTKLFMQISVTSP